MIWLINKVAWDEFCLIFNKNIMFPTINKDEPVSSLGANGQKAKLLPMSNVDAALFFNIMF
jgi:hypothetical protein